LVRRHEDLLLMRLSLDGTSEDEHMSSGGATPIRFEAPVAGYYGTPPAFAIVWRDEIELFFYRADQSEIRTGRARGSYDAYFRLVGVDALAAELHARSTDLLEGPVVRSYEQRELVIRDCNGLVLAFGEDTSRRAT
jgi:hypothetical protein